MRWVGGRMRIEPSSMRRFGRVDAMVVLWSDGDYFVRWWGRGRYVPEGDVVEECPSNNYR